MACVFYEFLLYDSAPLGHLSTVAIIFSVLAPAALTQGRALRLKTSGRVVTHFAAWIHFSGLQWTVISPLL
jgi:hypothetical protein